MAFAVTGFALGHFWGLFSFGFDYESAWYLPVIMFVFPSLTEEFFFRGLLIPNNVLAYGGGKAMLFVLASAALFTLWHPLNAYWFNHAAQQFFYDAKFLVLVFLLGLTCAYGYAISRSIWVPVIMHWCTIMVWVFVLGGYSIMGALL